ncbi:SIMPL domain-containing protein [Modestobacter italicus]|uniref:SIMPL domain-containing protein n=1 Tax=Modestobacter italicus (strain DSM 44449 / CECT 9708 / BC 501) TaxID=2732864 RepID=UPI001C96AE56|nr:SIMPL domain-containing protein [Modestobacter italicus]
MQPAPDSPRVVVRGEAVAEVLPDAADLVVTVQVRDRRRERALELLAGRQEELTALFDAHRAALGTVSTDAVAAFPEAGDGGRISGSVATTTTRARIADVGAAGELAVAVAGLSDVSVHGPHWRVSREHPAHQQVRTAAVQDAIVRARAYATALGGRLTGLVEVRDVGGRGGGMVMAAFSAPGGVPALELQPAPQEVTGQVEVTFTMSVPDQEVFAR